MSTPAKPSPKQTLASVRKSASSCQACPLFANATRTVFGEGPSSVRIVFVGEQPGDHEDRTGHVFVGPAGKLLSELLLEAGIDRQKVYLTNAVKHFKNIPRGKRRLHRRPVTSEINACHPWLMAELNALRPIVIVCLGAVAAQSLMGPAFRLTSSFGKSFHQPWAKTLIATYHPSALLRMPDVRARDAARKQLVSDLIRAKRIAGKSDR